MKARDGDARICVRQATVFSLRAEARPAAQYEKVSLAEFRRLLSLRGEAGAGSGLMGRVGKALERARRGASAIRYEKIQLFFDNVQARVAEDKVAETISGYLVAIDGEGAEARRPARRGIAYRMLKEYGNGNVYLALRSSYREVMMSMARHAMRAGDAEQGAQLLARSLA